MNSIAVNNNSYSIERITSIDYLLMLALLCISGNPFFSWKLNYLFFLIILLAFFQKKITSLAKRLSFSWVLLLSSIFIIQQITLGQIGYLACANFIVKFVGAILVASILGGKFKYAYLNVMTFISVFCLVCFLLSLFGFHFPDFMPKDATHSSIVLYTLPAEANAYDNFILRNCGMFWEPGAYAGYIIVAFLLFINNFKELLNKQRKKFIVLFVALVSTMSTTGFILLFAVFAIYLFRPGQKKAIIVLGLIIFIPVVIYLFITIPFLGEKITSQYEAASMLDYTDAEHSRFGTIIFQMPYIRLHPLFGNGLIMKTRFSMHLGYFSEEDLNGFGNGFFNSTASMGIIFMLIYFMATYKNRTLNRKWELVLMIILLMQGEDYLNYPLFMSLPFVVYGNNEKEKFNNKFIFGI